MKFLKSILLIAGVTVLLVLAGVLLSANDRLDLPFIHEGNGRQEDHAFFAELAGEEPESEEHSEDEHDHEVGEVGGSGTGRGAGGEGQGSGRRAGTGEGLNARPGDFWTVLSNLYLMAVIAFPVIVIDSVASWSGSKKRKGGA